MSAAMRALYCGVRALILCWSTTVVAQDVTFQGGSATSEHRSREAYDQVVPGVTELPAVLLHELGNAGFLRDFGRVKIRGRLRLGPRFNAPSCASCHRGNGRGAGVLSSRGRISDTVVKVSVINGTPQLPNGPGSVARLGTQLHDHAMPGYKPDAKLSLLWILREGMYADGSRYQLREPRLVTARSRITLPSATLFSVRRAPAVHGSGLLEAISDQEILSRADPDDTDGDGISGRPNRVWDLSRNTYSIGRFGFKAGSPSLRQQVASAYANDMGITNPLSRLAARQPEISDRILDATTFYTATLAVPRATNQDDPAVISGKALFSSFGCVSCHAVGLQTATGVATSLSNTLIHPFSDMLLHDMGAELADNRPEFEASGSEWRTTPLWGIGLADTVLADSAGYLHDGRARTLEEAILWHGGEALSARQQFIAAQTSEREALISFLKSL